MTLKILLKYHFLTMV